MENFSINGNGTVPEYSVMLKEQIEDTEIYTLKLRFPEKTMPDKTEISWFEPNKDAYSVWAPWQMERRELFPSWRRSSVVHSDSVHGMPVFQFNDKRGNNICCVALSDVCVPCDIDCGIDERTGKILIRIYLFTLCTEETENYETEIFVCRKRNPYCEVLKEVRQWWLSFYPEAFVPEAAKHRTYSSWYRFQKNLNEKELYEQCVLAKSYGMNTVIIDDGWQTPVCDQSGNAYITNGNWEPYEGKFPDFGAFIARIHNLGMNAVLWIATSYIGSECKNIDLFRDRKLRNRREDGSVFIPDPRYPEIRKWYVDFLSERMKRWNLDGFKLDFIDEFQLCGNEAPVKVGMDIPDINKANDSLLKEITAALRRINPEAMVEFRQAYIGPAMQQYGNMLRVDDCAYGAMYNRVNGIDLRLMTINCAVHSDMIMWDYDASVEAAADQLSALLFVVPQISVDFEKLNDEHKKMLHCYLDFIDSNKDVLLDGNLVPLYPEADYPVIYAERNGKVICGLYSADSFRVPKGAEKITVINASGSEHTCIDLSDSCLKEGKYVITDCMGQTVSDGKINGSLLSFDIPWNGFITIE